jgi:hypothetical protein
VKFPMFFFKGLLTWLTLISFTAQHSFGEIARVTQLEKAVRAQFGKNPSGALVNEMQEIREHLTPSLQYALDLLLRDNPKQNLIRPSLQMIKEGDQEVLRAVFTLAGQTLMITLNGIDYSLVGSLGDREIRHKGRLDEAASRAQWIRDLMGDLYRPEQKRHFLTFSQWQRLNPSEQQKYLELAFLALGKMESLFSTQREKESAYSPPSYFKLPLWFYPERAQANSNSKCVVALHMTTLSNGVCGQYDANVTKDSSGKILCADPFGLGAAWVTQSVGSNSNRSSGGNASTECFLQMKPKLAAKLKDTVSVKDYNAFAKKFSGFAASAEEHCRNQTTAPEGCAELFTFLEDSRALCIGAADRLKIQSVSGCGLAEEEAKQEIKEARAVKREKERRRQNRSVLLASLFSFLGGWLMLSQFKKSLQAPLPLTPKFFNPTVPAPYTPGPAPTLGQ